MAPKTISNLQSRFNATSTVVSVMGDRHRAINVKIISSKPRTLVLYIGTCGQQWMSMSLARPVDLKLAQIKTPCRTRFSRPALYENTYKLLPTLSGINVIGLWSLVEFSRFNNGRSYVYRRLVGVSIS